MRIPKIIHTVWAGGSRLLPANNILNLLHWQQLYPEFEIYLWIDKKTSSADLEKRYPAKFTEIASKHDIDVNLRLRILDIEENEVSDPFIRYEIDRLRPDYGASSDMIRYHALAKFGGIYADSDVGFTTRLPESYFTQDYPHHLIFVDPNAQGADEVGNDFFIATCDPKDHSSNPYFDFLIQLAHLHYTEHKDITIENPLFQAPLKSTYPSQFLPEKEVHEKNCFQIGEFRYASTPIRTGPGLVQKLVGALIGSYKIGDEPNTEAVRSLPKGYLEALREIGLQWTHPEIIRRFTTKEQAVEAIINTIQFEATRMKIFRLEDHIADLMASAHIDESEAVALLLPKIIEIISTLTQIEYAQFSFKSSDVFDFYCKYDLFKKTCAYPDPKMLGNLANNLLRTIDLSAVKIPATAMPLFANYLEKIIEIMKPYQSSTSFNSNQWKNLAAFTDYIKDYIPLFIETHDIKESMLSKFTEHIQSLTQFTDRFNQFSELTKFKIAQPTVSTKPQSYSFIRGLFSCCQRQREEPTAPNKTPSPTKKSD